ncbi:T9SS type A sorting domain-containing protein [Ferruginibacter sp. SUN002]|uniref:T9SS type A sorting domain-containing protein n=1 Tax=Ferruginibacter sp. SUN002 TaxID=2937789 RepID=UPI003D35DBFF
MNAVQLNIAKPCHENWDAMTPTEKGKFCSSCQKTVVDFTLMSDGELLRYLSSIKEKNICGNLYTDQLNRPILMPKEPAKPLPWYWSFVMMISLLFSKSLLKAQSVKGEVSTRPTNENVLLRGKIKCVKPVDTDTIPADKPLLDTLVNDTVVVTGYVTKKVQDVTGAITIIKSPKPKLYVVDGVVEESISDIDPKQIESIDVLKESPSSVIYGRISSDVVVITTKKKTTSELPEKITRFFQDTLTSITSIKNEQIRVYPNPLMAGERITVAFKVKNAGIFNLTILNDLGVAVLQKKITVNIKKHVESLETLTTWTSGMYFIKLTDSENNLISTSGFILE